MHKDDLRKKYLLVAETWVAEENGELLGFITLFEDYIGGLLVSPTKQGKGTGTKLIEQTKSVRRQLTVGIYSKNERARRFYEKNGFIYFGEEVQLETGEIVINTKFD